MKQSLDRLRTLAVELFEAGQREKRKQPPHIWGENRFLKFSELPTESIALWDAVALAALVSIRRLEPKRSAKGRKAVQ